MGWIACEKCKSYISQLHIQGGGTCRCRGPHGSGLCNDCKKGVPHERVPPPKGWTDFPEFTKK